MHWSLMTAKCGSSTTLSPPVVVMITSECGAASIIRITRKPSMRASSAFVASTSVTMTSAPRPRIRIATPLPTQP